MPVAGMGDACPAGRVAASLKVAQSPSIQVAYYSKKNRS
ncbi:hypothetical protein AGR13a_Lc90267 [Agrobacterium genomosp. 13 str. CFBP 6927]|uniref:Uncharacterized protein n=1 Tax=Agrobacterium genomosp. 13 str. CFBP 6927 TaxID=1183428 RepID=A0ABP2BPV3_9HYPH|nr:hypothetical protein AGR13a_Lc90267 [Agrobacterium genomosp. 13 str. CFBP 6927]